jgi:tetratricopeptide (TPR) repeat protein
VGTLVFFMGTLGRSDTEPELPFPENLDGVDSEVAAALQEAAAEAQQAPRDGRIVGHLAQLYHAHEYYELAQRTYEIAQRLAPDDPRWSYHLGVMAAKRGDTASASRWLRETIGVDPGYGPAHVHLGDVLAASGDLPAANAAYSRALELEPDNAWALGGRGRVAYESGRLQEALADLERSVASRSRPRHALYQLSLAYRDLGRFEEARREMQRYVEALDGIAMPDRRLQEVEARAKGLFGRLRKARIAVSAERFDTAQSIYEGILRDHPREFTSLMNLANLYFRQQRFGEAAGLLERAVEISPGIAHAHFGLATAYLSLQRLDDGERELRRALEIEPSHPQASRYLEQLGQMREANRRNRP